MNCSIITHKQEVNNNNQRSSTNSIYSIYNIIYILYKIYMDTYYFYIFYSTIMPNKSNNYNLNKCTYVLIENIG